eukprot:6476878-Pyramimonas_sp.AAC.1
MLRHTRWPSPPACPAGSGAASPRAPRPIGYLPVKPRTPPCGGCHGLHASALPHQTNNYHIGRGERVGNWTQGEKRGRVSG